MQPSSDESDFLRLPVDIIVEIRCVRPCRDEHDNDSIRLPALIVALSDPLGDFPSIRRVAEYTIPPPNLGISRPLLSYSASRIWHSREYCTDQDQSGTLYQVEQRTPLVSPTQRTYLIGRQRFSFDSYLSFQVIVHPLIVYPHLILKSDKDEFIGIR